MASDFSELATLMAGGADDPPSLPSPEMLRQATADAMHRIADRLAAARSRRIRT